MEIAVRSAEAADAEMRSFIGHTSAVASRILGPSLRVRVLGVCLVVCLFVVCWSVCLFVCLFVCLSVC